MTLYVWIGLRWHETESAGPCQAVLYTVSLTKFARYRHWVVSFSATEISVILKNKMATRAFL